MKSHAVDIGEVFLFAWEKGLRLDTSVTTDPILIYKHIPCEYLISVGWDSCCVPIEKDDIEFISQYSMFIELYKD